MDNPKRVKETELPTLVAAGAIRGVTVERAPGDGWAVRLRIGMADAVISSHHRPVRTWGSLDTLGRWLERNGIAQWEVRAA